MNDELELNDDDRVSDRRNRVNGKGKGSGAGNKILLFILIVVVLIFAPFIVVGPKKFAAIIGLSTSDTEELQKASKVDTGISTALPRAEPSVDVPDLNVPAPVAEAPEPIVTISEEEKARIAALEKRLEELANRPPTQAITTKEVTELLAAQSQTFRDEQKRLQLERDAQLRKQLAELRASLAPTGPSAEELAAQQEAQRQRELEAQELARQRERDAQNRQKREQLEEEAKARAEERRKKAEELRAKQIESDSVVFDGSEEGQSAPGSSDNNGNNDNVRELSNNEQFLQGAASAAFETSNAQTFGNLSERVIQGTIISAVLETAINTELPGNIRAQVTEPVFSYDGSRILMPAGTRLVGTFNTDINTAQSRVLIAWTRAITPEGQSVELGGTGTDKLGRSGTRGNVDSRFVQRFGSAILITAINAIPSLLSTESENTSVGAANDVANEASGDLADQSESALEDQLNLPPIIRIPQGEEIRVFVNRDLVFS